jgi:transposase
MISFSGQEGSLDKKGLAWSMYGTLDRITGSLVANWSRYEVPRTNFRMTWQLRLSKQLMAWHKSNPISQPLATIPGIGPIIATAIAATVTEPSGFCSGREFAAWLGLVPRQSSTGGKIRLGGISKRGNRYLRRLLINGASANLLRSKATNADPWVIGLRRRRPSLVVAVALANKTARIAWAVMQRQENYQRLAAAA